MSTIAPTDPFAQSAQALGTFKDSGNTLVYGTGTKGPNASNPGDPEANLGMVSKNGDSLTYSATKTKDGVDNSVAFARHGSGGEVVSRDLKSGDITALDNGKKYEVKNGNVTEDTPGQKAQEIGNINDPHIQGKLRESGMSRTAADDLMHAGRTPAQDNPIESLKSVQKDFTSSDLQDFNLIKNVAMGDEKNSQNSQAPNPLAESINQIFNAVMPGQNWSNINPPS